MKSTASGKNGKFAIVVFTYTCRVLQEMLPYSGERSFSFTASDWFATASQCPSVLRSVSLKNGTYFSRPKPIGTYFSSFEIMNILLSAIFKFCNTNQLFK